jgi:hypothetical protein
MQRIRLKLVYLLLGRDLKAITIRALVQGSDTWFECTEDPAMQGHPDDQAVVLAVKRDLKALSDFWTI